MSYLVWLSEQEGEDAQTVRDRLEVLERESAEHFERWHEERRHRERITLAAQALIKQWDSPDWKAPHTAVFIHALRDSLEEK